MLYIDTLSSFFVLSIAIRNMWSERMSLKAFIVLYMLLLLAGMPVMLFSCIPYGLFGILAVVCIYALAVYRDTAYQNIFLGVIGFVLAAVVDDLLAEFLNMLFPLTLSNQPYFSFGVRLIRILLFYLITLFCGRLLKRLLFSGKGILRLPQTWYLMDAVLLLLITVFLMTGFRGKMVLLAE